MLTIATLSRVNNTGKAPKRFYSILVTNDKTKEEINFTGENNFVSGDSTGDLFREINNYLSLLDDNVNQKLFDLFKKGFIILNPTSVPDEEVNNEDLRNSHNYTYLILRLRPIVEEIFETINLTNFTQYIERIGILRPPSDLEKTFGLGEYPEETTITNFDYHNIGLLSFVIRVVFPIISHFNDKVKEFTGKESKDIIASRLISDNEFIKNSLGYSKLKIYLEYNFQSKGSKRLVLSVGSKDKFAQQSLNKLLITKIPCAYIPALEGFNNIVKAIYGFSTNIESGDTSIQEKQGRERDETGEQKSLHEIYQLKDRVNVSRETSIAEYVSFGLYDEEEKPKYTNRFTHQCIGLNIKNEQMVETLYDLLPDKWDFILKPHVMKLCQIVFIDDINAQVIDAYEYDQMMCILVLATVKLFELGYKELALLPLSIPNPEGEVVFLEDVLKLTTEDKDRLVSICSVYRNQGNTKTDNEAVIAAASFLKGIATNPLHSVVNIDMLENNEALNNAKKGVFYDIEITREMKEEFLKLVFEMNKL